ncbi:UNVERIFIED_CONTAM: hypothetical protein Scaly_2780900 [Sesamum calycinum]|uniref:Uncharacterized protein n=1 Tax=Sesamum calycinum TaxID=2727403 RepID=A0AAW2IXH2_9LAMI
MNNDIQKQYDRLDDVPSIMLNMKEVYAVPDRHIRYAATKAFFRTKMAEGSSIHSHGIKILSLMEKLVDLKAGLDNDTYIDVILQSLSLSYDPFIINYNTNGLQKSINKLINMLVQYEATTHKSVPAVLVGEASTSKAKGGERSRWLSKDEMILRLGDGKAIAAEAGYAVKTAAKLLNMVPYKIVPQTPYEIWHGEPASYKYLRVWCSPAYVKRLVGDKLESKI